MLRLKPVYILWDPNLQDPSILFTSKSATYQMPLILLLYYTLYTLVYEWYTDIVLSTLLHYSLWTIYRYCILSILLHYSLWMIYRYCILSTLLYSTLLYYGIHWLRVSALWCVNLLVLVFYRLSRLDIYSHINNKVYRKFSSPFYKNNLYH